MSGGPKDPEDSLRVALEVGGLSLKLSASGSRQSIVLRPAIVFGHAPLGGDPRALFHAMERGVQRAVFNAQLVVGCLADPFRDGVAVHRTPRERLQDEEVERPL